MSETELIDKVQDELDQIRREMRTAEQLEKKRFRYELRAELRRKRPTRYEGTRKARTIKNYVAKSQKEKTKIMISELTARQLRLGAEILARMENNRD